MTDDGTDQDRLAELAELAELEEPDQLEPTVGGEPPLPWQRPDLRLLASPLAIRALIGMVAALAIIIWPDRTDRILARLLGLALVGLSVNGLRTTVRGNGRGGTDGAATPPPSPARRRGRLTGLAIAVVGLLAGGYLLAAPGGSEDTLARGVGALIAVTGVRDLIALRRRPDDRPRPDNRPATGDAAPPEDAGESDWRWPIVKSVALIVAGGLIVIYPSETFATITVMFALAWLLVGAVAVAVALDPDIDSPGGYRDAGALIGDWLMSRPKDADDRRALYQKILYEGPLLRRRLARFATLMAFAAVIASMGVITDSTAVVIGAMLIAPLMTPLMGMAISLVMGWPGRLRRSATVAAGGILIAISIGVILGLSAPTVIDTTTNGQIIARSSPTVLDLIIAVAAGAAGAYGLSRPDVSDSLPGVAIAISLVPPLTVVGIAYSQGDWGSGNGALLLFATNMLAIMIMGGITFVLTGVTPLSRVAENQHRVQTWMAAIATVGGLVLGALLLNGSQIADDAFRSGTVEEVVDQWLEPHPDHEVARVTIDAGTVTAVIIGPSTGSPPASELARRLGDAFDTPMTAEVRLLVEERDSATSE